MKKDMNKEVEKIYNVALDLIKLRLNKKEIVHPFTVVKLVDKEEPEIGMYYFDKLITRSQIEKICSNLEARFREGEITVACLCYPIVMDRSKEEKKENIQIEVFDKNGKFLDTLL